MMSREEYVGPPRWAIEKYEGAEKDFTNWLFDIVYNHLWSGHELDDEGKILAKSRTHFETLRRTLDIESTVERARMWQFVKMKDEGWLHLLPQEYETVEELLHDLLPEEAETSGRWWDLKFFIEEFMPYARANKIDIDKLISLPESWSKARELAPYLRKAVKADDKEAVDELLDRLDNKGQSIRDLRQDLKGNKAKEANIEMLTGKVFVMPDGNWMLIQVPNDGYTEAVKRALSNFVGDWVLSDVAQLYHAVAEIARKTAQNG